MNSVCNWSDITFIFLRCLKNENINIWKTKLYENNDDNNENTDNNEINDNISIKISLILKKIMKKIMN